jgi:hypothetical protein
MDKGQCDSQIETMSLSQVPKPVGRSIEHATLFDYFSHVLRLTKECSEDVAFRDAIGSLSVVAFRTDHIAVAALSHPVIGKFKVRKE